MHQSCYFPMACDLYSKKWISYADFLRSISFIIDHNPFSIFQYKDHACLKVLSADHHSTCLERTKMFEALSYGDAGALLACPGPSLAGILMRELGNEKQKKYFFDYIKSQKSDTFFAVTEPEAGSDISNIQTSLSIDSGGVLILQGEKWLVGHGATAPIGVIVARHPIGPLGYTALLLTPDTMANEAIDRVCLPMVGLKGALLSSMNFNQVPMTSQQILGSEKHPCERGMMAILKTFNRMRPCVAGLALGLSQAVLEYIYQHRIHFSYSDFIRFNALTSRLIQARVLLYQAARAIDENPLAGHLASFSKLISTRIAEAVSAASFSFFGSGAALEHPLLSKWYRDALGFEYMEGTEFMQKESIYKGFLKNVFS